MINAIAYFIAVDMQAYNVVEGRGFMKMIKTIQPNLDLPKRRHFSDQKIPKMVQKAITTDCWKSNVMQPILISAPMFCAKIRTL